MENEPTNGDVLKEVRAQGSRIEDVATSVADLAEAVNTFAENTEKRFDGLDKRLTGVETRLTGVEATMVTKDYLDEKLGRTDGKINALVNVLERKAVITTGEKSAILA